MIIVEDWAEIRRLHRSEGLGIKTIARRLGVARNTVRAAFAAHEPPKYERRAGGSSIDAFDAGIRGLLRQFPDMPATVIAERIGWERSASVLRARVALLRPLFKGADPADRTTYVPNGRLVQATGARHLDLLAEDTAAMGALPPVAPAVGTAARVRLGRDYYVRIGGNDYAVDPGVIGRFVDVHVGLGRAIVTCVGAVVADHPRSWASRQLITDPAHVQTATGLRTAFKARTAATR